MNRSALTTVSQHVAWAEKLLYSADVFFGHGCENAADEAIWAALHIAGLMDQDYDSVRHKTISEKQSHEFCETIRTRVSTRKPLAYLLNEAWFAQLPFYVDERVIVPRSHIGDFIPDGFSPWVVPERVGAILDLCTGSGCIAVALALQFPDVRVDAADIDPHALDVAKINVERYQCSERVRLVESNLFDQLKGRRYDLIVTNPPYVSSSEMALLPDEYHHEPPIALCSVDNGLSLVKQILCECAQHLTPGGHLVMELGNSAEALENAFPNIAFMWLTSNSGESVVLIISAEQLNQYQTIITGSGGL